MPAQSIHDAVRWKQQKSALHRFAGEITWKRIFLLIFACTIAATVIVQIATSLSAIGHVKHIAGSDAPELHHENIRNSKLVFRTVKSEIVSANADNREDPEALQFATRSAQSSIAMAAFSQAAVNPQESGSAISLFSGGAPSLRTPTFILSPPAEICSSKDLEMLTVVHSSPANYKDRMLIRETWGSRKLIRLTKNVVLFTLGRPLPQETAAVSQDAIEMESHAYNDIIQGAFDDTYRNLTQKALTWLSWVSQHCSTVNHVLKTDDDVIVNVFNVATHLRNLRKYGQASSRTFACNAWYGMIVQRNNASKWYVSPSDWDKETFPVYCSGMAYVLTGDLVALLSEKAQTTKSFWVDDAFITGILPLTLNISVSYHQLASLYVIDMKNLDSRFLENFALFGHVPGPDSRQTRRRIWDALESRRRRS